MKEKIKIKTIYSVLYSRPAGYIIARLILSVWHFFSFRIYLSDEKAIKVQFYKTHGYKLNLSNPKTLNEKIQWLKLHDRAPIQTICADKYLVREIYKEKCGFDGLIDLVFETTKWKDIKEENMPDFPVIIKPNHGSGWYHIVTNKNEVDWHRIRTDCRYWLSMNAYNIQREWPYKHIKRRIIVEKLLLDKNGRIPTNFRLHCFHGEVKLIALTIYDDNSTIGYKNQKYSRDWQLLNIDWAAKDVDLNEIRDSVPKPKPRVLNEMINRAEILSKGFKYIRVDFYEVDDKIYQGEMTFYDGGGYEIITPYDWDIKLGELLKLGSTPE